MLEAILDYLHNWFPVKGAAKSGTFEIASGVLAFDGLLQGQYYRVQGSVFNDGLHKAGERLTDEVFSGTVTPLAVPAAVQELAGDIEEWCEANPVTDKVSESFDGYSYSRAAGISGWQMAFAPKLARWRRPCE